MKIKFLILFSLILQDGVIAQLKFPAPVSANENGKLIYQIDSLGNRIPDFSFCGYMAGEQLIPAVPVRVFVPLKSGDATHRVQAAINYVGELAADKNGIRGAVLLEKGAYEIFGQLFFSKSGVILRGSGTGEHGTIILGKGKTRNTLFVVSGVDDKRLDTPVKIGDSYVPVNAMDIFMESQNSFMAGDKVFIHRPCTKAWIDKLQMNEFGGETSWLGWKQGTRDLYWDRTILAVEGRRLILDAPVTTALDINYGGGYVMKYNWPGRISQVGIENLQCVSEYDTTNAKDEDHRGMAITIENAQNCWVRQVIFKHFAGSAVAVYETAKKITVEDCKSLAPVSEIGGYRRITFFTSGQQVLFQRCYSEYGYHDFSTGFCAAGPNAFVQCESLKPYNFSGSINSWSSGTLFDIVNIDGQKLSFANLGQDKQGTGWNAANSVFWQCTAAKIECFKPPMSNNWAVGAWAQFAGDGSWYEPNSHVKPRSLYYAQLADRLGDTVLNHAFLLPVSTEVSSSPTLEQAEVFVSQSVKPAIQLSEWIDYSPERTPLDLNTTGILTIEQIISAIPEVQQKPLPVSIENGWLVCNGEILTGIRHNVSWWRGNPMPFALKDATPHITRYVPGRTGTGLTDDLNSVVKWMTANNIISIEHNYGLWYDRRRDDHERIRRMDGDVWAPFYELPFARSGKETAWDGLSKYDLTKYNYWYWNRLKQFSDLADENGVLLIHQHYFQHNILEAGAHWADFPWRDANNINNTGFPEPPPYAGDKRIFMAEQFYDISHPVRRVIHRLYIRKCLDNFSDNSNVIHSVSAEYTGPLHFIQFWMDVVMEWEKETGKNVLVSVSATKDVQDSILSDPIRNNAVDIIDIRYWHYHKDSSLYAPEGGKNLAPRQHARLVKPGESSFKQVYCAVSEYRINYPEKTVIYSSAGQDKYPWAVFMAGGSLAAIPSVDHPGFIRDASLMRQVDISPDFLNTFVIGKPDLGYIVYDCSHKPVVLDLTNTKGTFKVLRINPDTGQTSDLGEKVKGGNIITFKNQGKDDIVIWLKKN